MPGSAHSALPSNDRSFGIKGDPLTLQEVGVEGGESGRGNHKKLSSDLGGGQAPLFSTMMPKRPLMAEEVTASPFQCTTGRGQSQASTYLVHDPVGIFNGSFNNLLDSLGVVFV